MLKLISDVNAKKDNRLLQFNSKIVEYNKIPKNNASLKQRLTLLQEIHFVSTRLLCVAIDEKAITDESGDEIPGSLPVDELLNWRIPVEEFEAMGKPNMTDLIVKKMFIDSIKDDAPLMSVAEWQIRIKIQDGSGINKMLDQAHQIKARKGGETLDYYYSLQQLREKLLIVINDNPPLSKTRLFDCRALLMQVNAQISSQINSNHKLRSMYLKNDSIDLVQNFSSLPQDTDKKKSIAGILCPRPMELPEPAPVLREKLKTSGLGSIDQYELKYLGGGNNKNWLLTNPETSINFVIRGEPKIHPNQVLINHLHNTNVNDFLSLDYITIRTNEDKKTLIPEQSITLTEYAKKGDIYSKRTNFDKNFNDDDSILNATKDLGQVIKFCQTMVMNEAIHPDIKLKNFLMRDNREIFVADQKALMPTQGGKLICNKWDILHTGPFDPPEYSVVKGGSKTVNFDAEKYMCYQVGLALYDYLALPGSDPDESDKMWSQKDKLDFDKPIFNSIFGKEMMLIIQGMTREKPSERISLKDAARAMNLIHSALEPCAKLTDELQSIISRKTIQQLTKTNSTIEVLIVNLDRLIIQMKQGKTYWDENIVVSLINLNLQKLKTLSADPVLKENEDINNIRQLITTIDHIFKEVQQKTIKNKENTEHNIDMTNQVPIYKEKIHDLTPKTEVESTDTTLIKPH